MKIQVFWDTTLCRLVRSYRLLKEFVTFRALCMYACIYIYMYTHTELSLQRANNHLPVDIASCSKLVGTSLTPLP